MAHQRNTLLPCRARTCTPSRRGGRGNVGHSGGVLLFKKTECRRENIPFQSLPSPSLPHCGGMKRRGKKKVAAHVDCHYLSGTVIRLEPCVSHKHHRMRAKTTRNLILWSYFSCNCPLTTNSKCTESIYMVLSFTYSHSHSLTNGWMMLCKSLSIRFYCLAQGHLDNQSQDLNRPTLLLSVCGPLYQLTNHSCPYSR